MSFPQKVRATSLMAVNESVRQHIHLDKAHMAMAGTLPEE